MGSALATKSEEKKSAPEVSSEPVSEPRSNGLSGAVAGLPRFLQTKLMVGPPGDEHEQEADRVSDTVANSGSASVIQRKCAVCASGGNCPKCEKKENRNLVQRKTSDPATIPSPSAVPQDAPSFGAGQPLEPDTRLLMESSFGYDFGDVRVHNDAESARSAIRINARAYTAGSDVVFAPSEYSPHSPDGKRLLAHELTHVVQQSEGSVSPPHIQRQATRQSITPAFAASLNNEALQAEIGSVRQTLQDSSTPVANKDALQQNLAVMEGELRSRNIAPQYSSPPGDDLDARVESFKSLVKNAARRRLAMNRVALAEWETFLTTQLSPGQTQAQTFATLTEQLQHDAGTAGLQEQAVYEQWTSTHNPEIRWVLEQQIHGRFRACTGCHAMRHATEWGYSVPHSTEDWLLPRERIDLSAKRAAASVSPELQPPATGAVGSASTQLQAPNVVVSPPAQPATPAIDRSMYPGAAATADAVSRVHPFLQQLGPEGYKVLPEESVNLRSSPKQLLAEISDKIGQRQVDYLKLSNRIANGDVEYYELGQVFLDLLPLAAPDVQTAIHEEADRRELIQDILSGLLIGLSIALLLIPIVGPALGMSAAAMSTTMTVSGYALAAGMLYRGMEGIRIGRNLMLGQGAYNVFTPAQRAQAGEVLLSGICNVAFAVFSVVSSTMALARNSFAARPMTFRQGAVTITVAEDGTLMATHSEFPDAFVIVRDGQATGYMLVNGEFQPVASRPFATGVNPESYAAPDSSPGTAAAPWESGGATTPGQAVVGWGPSPMSPPGVSPPRGLPMLPGQDPFPLLAGPTNQAVYLGPSTAQRPLITPPPAVYPALPPGPPFTRSLNQVLNLRGPERYEAGELYVQETYGGQAQVHRPVPMTTGPYPVTKPGGRFTDVSAPGGRGKTLGIEVKTYLRWRTVEGRPVEQSVPLTPQIREQVHKDAQLMATDQNFEPLWIFLDAPPHPELIALLRELTIRWIHQPRPTAVP